MRRSLLRHRFICARIDSLGFAIEEQKQSMWSDFASPLQLNRRRRTLRIYSARKSSLAGTRNSTGFVLPGSSPLRSQTSCQFHVGVRHRNRESVSVGSESSRGLRPDGHRLERSRSECGVPGRAQTSCDCGVDASFTAQECDSTNIRKD